MLGQIKSVDSSCVLAFSLKRGEHDQRTRWNQRKWLSEMREAGANQSGDPPEDGHDDDVCGELLLLLLVVVVEKQHQVALVSIDLCG